MFEKAKRFLVGGALKDTDLGMEKFSVKWGLPIYSSDAISSVAYAGEEMLIVLVPALFLGAYKYYILCIAAILFLLLIHSHLVLLHHLLFLSLCLRWFLFHYTSYMLYLLLYYLYYYIHILLLLLYNYMMHNMFHFVSMLLQHQHYILN